VRKISGVSITTSYPSNFAHLINYSQSVYLKKAVEVTIDYQKSIYREVYSILEKKAVKSTSDFRYAVVSNEYFSNKFNPSYLSLQKISMTLLDIYKVKFSSANRNRKLQGLRVVILSRWRCVYWMQCRTSML
jgi:hypothetical protein